MVVSAGPFFVTPTLATATPIEYTLSDATATFTNPSPSGTLTLTGSFTFDPSNTTLDAVNILITGPTSILPGAPEMFDVPLPSFVSTSNIGACVGPCVVGAPAFQLVFTTDLSLAPSPLEFVFVGDFVSTTT
jgi:hypothetical protein